MFLKRLDISGFKSFATKSVLDFEQGKHITAIVGPNGSGKSNVADAVRWVLGEQSYKAIRSKKSEDVIFAGSGGKNKGSVAKVSMVLDNSDGKAPVDFTDIEISRAIYRDGSGEYLIAGKKSRLLDVSELLAKSGFGQSTYSVIGQGMVDSMLFYGPAERKVLFDEAAGVRQYEIKREQTIRKLEGTHSNIFRAKDILSELNPRLGHLKRQASKAKQKDEIKGTLLEKQKVYYASVWEKLTHQESEKRKELERISQEEENVKAELAELNKKFSKILGQEKTDNSKADELRSRINKLEDQKDKLKQEIYTERARIQMKYSDAMSKEELGEKISLLEKKFSEIVIEPKLKEKELLKSKIESGDFGKRKEKIAKLEVEKDELKQRIYIINANLNFFESSDLLSIKEIDAKISKLNKEINNLKISDKEKEKEKIQKEVSLFDNNLEKIKAKIESKKKDLSELREELESFDFGVVGEELNSILETQNLFLIEVQSAEEAEAIKKAVEKGRTVVSCLEKLIDKVSGAKKGMISGMAEIQEEIENLSADKEKLVSEKNELRSSLLEIEHLINSLIRRRSEIKKEIEKLKKIKPVDGDSKLKLEKELAELELRVKSIDSELQKNDEGLAEEVAFERELMTLEYEIERMESQKRDIKEEIKKFNNIKPVDEGDKGELEKKIIEREKEIEKINSEIDHIRDELNTGLNNFAAAGKKLTAIKDEITKKQALVNEYNGETTSIKVDLGRIDTKKQDVREDIIREFGSEEILVDAKGHPELDEYAAREEIEKLKTKLYAIGEIDPEVEEEFAEVEERVTYLDSQIGDLEKAKGDLEKLIKDLDSKIKKQFEGSFSAISKKFTHFFEVLFDGGEARLELVRSKDEETGEESFGIEITAVPPGKKVKSLSALSGGERTMTSLALLFAILTVNPAPFVMLDEVDAALDESNTKRFLKIVRELSKDTQFIFITHNRETMKEASLLYGVTMDDSHASKLISIKLEDAIETIKK